MKIFCVFAGIALMVFGWGPAILFLFSLPSFASSWARLTPSEKIPLALVSILFGYGALIFPVIVYRFLKRSLRAKAVWSHDSVELIGRRGYQRLQNDEIMGRKNVREERGWSVELVSKNPDAKKFVLPMEWVLPFDSDFKNWVRAIPEIQKQA